MTNHSYLDYISKIIKNRGKIINFKILCFLLIMSIITSIYHQILLTTSCITICGCAESVVHSGSFNSGMRTLSCGMRDWVP